MIEALFVGGPMNGRMESLHRPFPSHTFRSFDYDTGKKKDLVYVLDLKNFEPHVYVLKGLKQAEIFAQHNAAMSVRKAISLSRGRQSW